MTTVYLPPDSAVKGVADEILLRVREDLSRFGLPGEVIAAVVSKEISIRKAVLGGIVGGVTDFINLLSGDEISLYDYPRPQFDSFNLIMKEAVVVSGERNSKIGPEWALKMVNPDEHNREHHLDYYFKHINRDASYTVPLGKHRIVMIDGKWDSDPIDTLAEAFAYKLADHHIPGGAAVSDDAVQFTSGSPNGVGFDPAELDELKGRWRPRDWSSSAYTTRR